MPSLMPSAVTARIKVYVINDHEKAVQKVIGLKEHRDLLENIRKEIKRFTIDAIKAVNEVPTETCESKCEDDLK